MEYKIEDIIDDLVRNYSASVTRVRKPKYIVFLDDVEYKIKNDSEMVDFYKNFCGMLKYS